MRPAPNGGVIFAGDLRNNWQRVTEKVYVIAWTAGLAEYQIRGQIPDHWIRVESLKDAEQVRGDQFDYAGHLSPIQSCFVHAVSYPDGSFWKGPAPG